MKLPLLLNLGSQGVEVSPQELVVQGEELRKRFPWWVGLIRSLTNPVAFRRSASHPSSHLRAQLLVELLVSPNRLVLSPRLSQTIGAGVSLCGRLFGQ